MDNLEIRRVIADVLNIELHNIGVLRGDNLTIVTVAEAHSALMTEHNKSRVIAELAVAFGPSYIHLGFIRFL